MPELDEGMFADYRSEWIGSDFEERFVEPPYYRRFLDIRPTLLVGGRGTGKTVTLRSLHFSNVDANGEPRHLGLYVKAFKNRVTAFAGSHLEEEVWIMAFEHYMNLLCCIELAALCIAVFKNKRLTVAQQDSVRLLCQHFSIEGVPKSYTALHEKLRLELASLTRYVVAPRIAARPPLSPGELPVVEFAQDVHNIIAEEGRRPIYICIDEWENLSERQQEAMNCWIKNSSAPISYKIAVRQNGIRSRQTGSGDDPLASPTDYSEEDISGDENFCMQVVEKRLSLAQRRGFLVPSTLAGFLPAVEPEEEARTLGAFPIVEEAAIEQERNGHVSIARWLRRAPLDEAYLALHLQERGLGELRSIIAEAEAGGPHWEHKIDNYRHASLFTITRGMKGVSRRKLYTGPRTFLTLSGGNVRYLLELLDEVVRIYLRDLSERKAEERGPRKVEVGGELQTRAARAVAKRHLDQIQGLSTQGLSLARLVRSIGAVFYELIRNPRKNAPEQTGFTLIGEKDAIERATLLLEEGCAILSFLSDSPSKLTHPTETQQNEYRLHPILAPHFNISHRRKRRRQMDAGLLLRAADGVEGAKELLSSMTGEAVSEQQMELLKE